MRGSTDVAIVGGGVLGTAIALHLAEAGLDVTLLERDGVGQATSAAGAGFIGMWAAGWTPTFGREHIEIERYGLDFYRELAEHEEFGYRANGNLYVATTEEAWDAQIAPKLLDADAVPSLQRLSPGEVAEITGIIPPASVYGGILHPDGAQVSAGRAACALARRFVIAGGRLETRTPVTGLRTRRRSGHRRRDAARPAARRARDRRGRSMDERAARDDRRAASRCAAGRVPRRHRATGRARDACRRS